MEIPTVDAESDTKTGLQSTRARLIFAQGTSLRQYRMRKLPQCMVNMEFHGTSTIQISDAARNDKHATTTLYSLPPPPPPPPPARFSSDHVVLFQIW